MTNQDLYIKEQSMLRSELHDLKDCQVKFLHLSVTSTAVLLGITVTWLTSDTALNTAFLFPLLVVIPSWWIFFDKATTITRIVGYYRNIEKLVLGTHSGDFIGWENALEIFREKQEKGELISKSKPKKGNPLTRIINLIFLNTTHRYWIVTYYTYLGLSFLCLALSYNAEDNSKGIVLIIVSSAIFLLSTLWNFNIIYQLIWGRHSYTANEEFWEEILSIEEKKKVGSSIS
jgi:hypothetical protein